MFFIHAYGLYVSFLYHTHITNNPEIDMAMFIAENQNLQIVLH